MLNFQAIHLGLTHFTIKPYVEKEKGRDRRYDEEHRAWK